MKTKIINKIGLMVLLLGGSLGTQAQNHAYCDLQNNTFGNISLQSSTSWTTDRTPCAGPPADSRVGYFGAIGANGQYSGMDDAHHVDGYVKHIADAANQPFTFPVGSGSDLRSLSISGTRSANNELGVAWIAGDPSGNLDPTSTGAAKGAHAITSVSGPIVAVSPVGQWDWQDLNAGATGATVTVSIPDMSAFATAGELRLVGWNGSQWVDLSGGATATGVAENSSLSGTMIAGITALGIGKGQTIITEPDMNVTLVDIAITGDVHTNDDVPSGSTYGTPIPMPGNPSGDSISMNPDGTYTFISSLPGEYNYNVPVCPPGISVGCPTELLTITVLEPLDTTAAPTANPDVATTLQNTPITVDIRSNDACNNGPSCTLTNPTIISGPNNGTLVVDPSGTVTYTPALDYIGMDTLTYSVCDNQVPSKCDTEVVVLTVLPSGSPNSTEANDDYAVTDNNTPVSGNVLDNDTDPQSHTQTVTPQNITTPKWTLVLNANGTYTFTPNPGVNGTVSTVYTVCDNGTPSACDSATLTILINDEIPDLTPVIAITPGITHGIQSVESVVDVYNITGEPTTGGAISVYISKDSRYSINFNPTATTVAGRAVSNASWTLDATSNPSFYIFTTNNVMSGLSGLNFGYQFNFDPQNANGTSTISATIFMGSGGERNEVNNNDNTTLTYFIN